MSKKDWGDMVMDRIGTAPSKKYRWGGRSARRNSRRTPSVLPVPDSNQIERMIERNNRRAHQRSMMEGGRLVSDERTRYSVRYYNRLDLEEQLEQANQDSAIGPGVQDPQSELIQSEGHSGEHVFLGGSDHRNMGVIFDSFERPVYSERFWQNLGYDQVEQQAEQQAAEPGPDVEEKVVRPRRIQVA